MSIVVAELTATTRVVLPIFIQLEGAVAYRIIGSGRESQTENLDLTGGTEVRMLGGFELKEREGKLEAFAQIGVAKENPNPYWVALRVLRTTR